MNSLETRMLDAWTHTLKLSKVKKKDNVVIINAIGREARYKNVAILACERLGASVSYLEVADRNNLPESVLALVRAADLVIDLVFVFDGAFHAARERYGTRVLAVLEPPEILERMLPSLDDRERALAAEKLLRASRHVRVTSAAGTDLSFEVGQYRVASQYGFSDTEGHWDQWPGVFVFTFANDNSGDGRVVFDTCDMVFPFDRYFTTPTTLNIENGWIRSIEGGYEAELLKSYMESFKDLNVYALSHLGWGLSHNGRWEALGLHQSGVIEGQDARGYAGNFLFSTGPNDLGGGTRRTPCHIDMPMRRCTIELDGVAAVTNGMLMEPPVLRAAE
jgi:2,5-dihydroxypyridine 5,6-dioxygenase